MNKSVYSLSEIEAEHDYVTPHIECGLKLHGGFDTEGTYLSPRTRNRWQAIEAWSARLAEQNITLVEASTDLLSEPNYPSIEQQIFLLNNGVKQPLWDSLTITGIIEGRGKALADLVAPDFQSIIKEDISQKALGHMNKGLLSTHGWDEGGNPATDIGGHDVMWYAVRDLIFGKDKFPTPEAPSSIGREKDEREMHAIGPEFEGVMAFLMNLLMIEVRAERAFDFYEKVIGSDRTFTDKLIEAKHAVELVNRIRQDESVHVAWLKVAISEFRSSTIKTLSGSEVNGAELLDPVWAQMVQWHAVDMHKANYERSRLELKKKILVVSNGEKIFAEFEAMAIG
ncbi:MAG: hypothetical protein ACJAVI_003618 [Candidatus Azotimanducaceae bacterium]|jgi:hypothetical protein